MTQLKTHALKTIIPLSILLILLVLQSNIALADAPYDDTFISIPQTLSITENSDNFTISIIRSGDLTDISSVDFTTVDGTANSSIDYNPSVGSVSFLADETSKNVTITVNDDLIYTGNRVFYFQIFNPANSVLGINNTTVTIADNEAVPSPPVYKDDNMGGIPETLLYLMIAAVFIFLIISFVDFPIATPELNLSFRVITGGLTVWLSWIVNTWLTSSEVEYSIAAGFLICRSPELALVFLIISILMFVFIVYQIILFAVEELGSNRKNRRIM